MQEPKTQTQAMTKSPVVSSQVQVKSKDEAPVIKNNLAEPEYDFLSKQPTEIVDETYKVDKFEKRNFQLVEVCRVIIIIIFESFKNQSEFFDFFVFLIMIFSNNIIARTSKKIMEKCSVISRPLSSNIILSSSCMLLTLTRIVYKCRYEISQPNQKI